MFFILRKNDNSTSLYLEEMTNHVLYIYGEWKYKFFIFRGNGNSCSLN